jgi:hypothetical protein
VSGVSSASILSKKDLCSISDDPGESGLLEMLDHVFVGVGV